MEEDENVVGVVQRSPHTLRHTILPVSAFRTWQSGQRRTQKIASVPLATYAATSTCGQGTLLEFCHLHVVNANRQVIRNILFIYEFHCTCYRDNSTKNPIYIIVTIQNEEPKVTTNTTFP